MPAHEAKKMPKSSRYSGIDSYLELNFKTIIV